MDYSDLKDSAAALLATVQNLLSGRECAVCEWAMSGEMEDELDSAIRRNVRHDDDGNGVSYYHAETLARREFEELRVLNLLQTQFAREIGHWLNQRNADYSRKAVRA